MLLTTSEGKFDVPAGTHRGRFLGVVENNHPEYGPGLKWRFEITEGPCAGKETSRSTGKFPGRSNACGRIVAGLAGGSIDLGRPGTQINPDQWIGKEYVLLVEQGAGKGTRVGSVMPAPVSATPAPVSATPAPPPPVGFWVMLPGEAQARSMDAGEVELWLSQHPETSALALPVLKVGDPPPWRSAADYGLAAVDGLPDSLRS
jgi:hypothetical protein